MSKRELEPEVRVNRNYIRSGDPCKVKLPNKTQFNRGFTFKGWDPIEGKAVVVEPKRGTERYVDIEAIQRVTPRPDSKRP